MTLPDRDNVATFGGLLNDFAPVTDPTTDRPSGGATAPTTGSNIAYVDVAMLTLTGIRAWARITTAASTGAMVLVGHYAMWGTGAPVAPTIARTSTGIFTITWPSSVQDQALVSHTPSFLAGWSNCSSVANIVHGVSVSGNVATLSLLSGGSANDAVGQSFDVFVI